ncbi:phosphatidylcholine and lysophosphatidylcholine phospholipase, partial [Spiromyces aspiralis]
MSPLAMNVDYALEWMQVRSSQVVYRRGDSNDAVHVVLSGRLRAIRQRADGQLGMIAEYGQSQAVGESGLLFDHPRTFTLHAIRDSELVRIPKTLFGALASKYPALTFHIARVVTAQGAVARQWRGQQHEHGGHETAGALDEDPLAASPLPLPLSGSGSGPAADPALPLAAGPGGYNANLKTVGIVPVHADVPVGEFARRLKQALAGQGADAVLLNSTTMSTVFGPRVFAKVGKLRIQNWLAGLEKRHRLILYVADDNVASGWTQHCIRHADCILLVGIGLGDTSIGEYERLMLGMKTTARKELVLLHPERQCPPGTTRSWLQHRIWIQAYHHVQMPLWAARGDGDGNGDGDGDGDGAAEGYVGNRGHHPQHQRQRQHYYYYYYHHQHHGSRPRRILRLLTRDIRTRMHASLNALLPHVFSPAARGLAVLRSRLRSSSGYASQVMPVGGGASQPTPSLFRGNRSDFARLARRLCNRSIGVTMSGGGARGIALIGILRAFEEAGIPVDMVGGTSIGAFVSGLYSCSAADTVSLYGRAKSFSKDMSALWRMAIDVTWPWLAYTSGNEFNRAIWKIFKDIQIEDLWLPFFCVSTNITRSKAEVHTAGFAWKYIRASMSLSSIVPPLCDTNGEMLMDGAYLDNLPVGIMQRMMRPEMVFALDIAGEDDTSLVHYGSAVSGLRVLLNHLNPFRRYKIPTLSDVQSRLSFCASSAQLEWVKKANACVYLKVPPGNTSVADFGRFDELYEKGYRYGRAWVKKWEEEGLLD